MRELAPTLHYEFELIVEMSGVLDRIRRLAAPVLLLGGSQSPAFLKRGLDAIEARLANVTRLELAGVGHGAAWNTDRGGRPERVAKALRDFFA
jgi:pimeloyl-ACP methyl ester carboxylesterase